MNQERQQIEHWRLKGVSVAEIAMLLQRHRSTIYRELKRGTVINKRSDLSEFSVYRAQRAQDDYTRNSAAGGPYLKLSWNSKEAKRLCELMTVNKLSPYAAVEVARRKKLNINFSSRSLYNYIHQYGYPITCEQLPMKNKRKKSSKASSVRLAHNNVKGDSMEQGCSEKHSKASLAIKVPNSLIPNPWRSRYSIRPTEPNFITLIHFHHLNEEANRFIRRILPKKTTFDTLTQNDINSMDEWMNRYPRRIFNGQSARTKARIENLHFIKFAA